jgi:hypothetical protein
LINHPITPPGNLMTKFPTTARHFLFIVILSVQAFATTPPGINSISRTNFEPHLRFLASDELEGREATFAGQRIAADFIASVFESYGLEPTGDESSYFQKFNLIQTKPGNQSVISVKNTETTEEFIITGHGESFLLFGLRNAASITAPVVFAHYGIISEDLNLNDYADIDVGGKIVVLLDGDPAHREDTEPTRRSRLWFNNTKVATARQQGAVALLVIADTLRGNTIATYRNDLADLFTKGSFSLSESDRPGFPMGFIDIKTASLILGDIQSNISEKEDETGQEVLSSRSFQVEGSEITLNYDVTHDFRETENVIGLIPGADPLLRDEYIIITAHYDHLGVRTTTGEIFNGADDNASGTAGILELARIFSDQRSDIRRSLLFIAFTAEEKGLLGSRYYTDNPVVPLEQTIVNLNLDMIGRVDARYSEQEDTNYVYIIGSDRLSANLHSINERALALVPEITADYRYNDPNDPNRFYFRSDHYNFIRHNIPAIFYFTGTHEDYHMPTDTADKIDFDRMETILRLVYATAWKLAETETRPLPDAVPSE